MERINMEDARIRIEFRKKRDERSNKKRVV